MDFTATALLFLKSRRWADYFCLALCFLSFAFLLAPTFFSAGRSALEVTPLAASKPESAGISGSGFAVDAVYPGTIAPLVRGAIRFYGSWLGSDASVGSAHSAWYGVKPDTYIWIAGYPSHPEIDLKLEIISGSSRALTVPLVFKTNPGLRWELLKLPLQHISSASKFRIVAVDQSKTLGGWVGFSAPFTKPLSGPPNVARQLLLVLLTVSAAVAVYVSPGLLLRERHLRRSGKLLPFIWIPVPGFLVAGVLGVASWSGPSWAPGTFISTGALLLLFICLLNRVVRGSIYAYTSQSERKALLVVILLTAVAVSKSTYSIGPAGELYKGTISRTLQVGDRSDSRISFHVVQLVAHRESPHHALAQALFSPWNFSSRGPLAALAASPLVLTSGAKLPTSFPDQSWMIYDPEGFAAYRIAMIVMAASCLLMVFGISVTLMNEQWALLAFLATVTTPFVIHEIYFTWPKLEAASFVLLAAYLLRKAKWFSAGLALGVGYLCHPSALLSVPALLGLILLIKVESSGYLPFWRRLLVWTSRAAFLFLGLAIWIAVWRLVNRHQFDQSGFLSYFRQADLKTPNTATWLRSRLDSLLNTIVPLNLFLFHRDHPGINSVEGPSPPVVSFFFQCWTGLPFGIGIAYFFCLLKLGFLAMKKAAWITTLLYVVPFAIFTIYWGAASTGMLREGLHAWFLGLTIGSTLVLNKFAHSNQQLFRFVSWALLFRILEILSMLLLPSVWSQHALVQKGFTASDSFALFVMVSGTAWLVVLAFHESESLRVSEKVATSPVPVFMGSH